MSCRDIQQQLPLFSVDGLSTRERARVAEHLATCAACRRELELLTRATALVERLPVPTPPPGLWDRVAAVTVERRARHLVWWQPAVAFATLALLLIGGLSLRHPTAPVAPLAPAGLEASAYADQYRLTQVQDPLADRAGVGLLLVEAHR